MTKMTMTVSLHKRHQADLQIVKQHTTTTVTVQYCLFVTKHNDKGKNKSLPKKDIKRLIHQVRRGEEIFWLPNKTNPSVEHKLSKERNSKQSIFGKRMKLEMWQKMLAVMQGNIPGNRSVQQMFTGGILPQSDDKKIPFHEQKNYVNLFNNVIYVIYKWAFFSSFFSFCLSLSFFVSFFGFLKWMDLHQKLSSHSKGQISLILQELKKFFFFCKMQDLFFSFLKG